MGVWVRGTGPSTFHRERKSEGRKEDRKEGDIVSPCSSPFEHFLADSDTSGGTNKPRERHRTREITAGEARGDLGDPVQLLQRTLAVNAVGVRRAWSQSGPAARGGPGSLASSEPG